MAVQLYETDPVTGIRRRKSGTNPLNGPPPKKKKGPTYFSGEDVDETQDSTKGISADFLSDVTGKVLRGEITPQQGGELLRQKSKSPPETGSGSITGPVAGATRTLFGGVANPTPQSVPIPPATPAASPVTSTLQQLEQSKWANNRYDPDPDANLPLSFWDSLSPDELARFRKADRGEKRFFLGYGRFPIDSNELNQRLSASGELLAPAPASPATKPVAQSSVPGSSDTTKWTKEDLQDWIDQINQSNISTEGSAIPASGLPVQQTGIPNPLSGQETPNGLNGPPPGTGPSPGVSRTDLSGLNTSIVKRAGEMINPDTSDIEAKEKAQYDRALAQYEKALKGQAQGLSAQAIQRGVYTSGGELDDATRRAFLESYAQPLGSTTEMLSAQSAQERAARRLSGLSAAQGVSSAQSQADLAAAGVYGYDPNNPLNTTLAGRGQAADIALRTGGLTGKYGEELTEEARRNRAQEAMTVGAATGTMPLMNLDGTPAVDPATGRQRYGTTLDAQRLGLQTQELYGGTAPPVEFSRNDFIVAMGKKTGEAGYNPAFDIDKDGTITENDISIVGADARDLGGGRFSYTPAGSRTLAGQTLDQSSKQFAQSLGIEQQKVTEGIRQFNETTKNSLMQFRTAVSGLVFDDQGNPVYVKDSSGNQKPVTTLDLQKFEQAKTQFNKDFEEGKRQFDGRVGLEERKINATLELNRNTMLLRSLFGFAKIPSVDKAINRLLNWGTEKTPDTKNTGGGTNPVPGTGTTPRDGGGITTEDLIKTGVSAAAAPSLLEYLNKKGVKSLDDPRAKEEFFNWQKETQFDASGNPIPKADIPPKVEPSVGDTLKDPKFLLAAAASFMEGTPQSSTQAGIGMAAAVAGGPSTTAGYVVGKMSRMLYQIVPQMFGTWNTPPQNIGEFGAGGLTTQQELIGLSESMYQAGYSQPEVEAYIRRAENALKSGNPVGPNDLWPQYPPRSQMLAALDKIPIGTKRGEPGYSLDMDTDEDGVITQDDVDIYKKILQQNQSQSNPLST